MQLVVGDVHSEDEEEDEDPMPKSSQFCVTLNMFQILLMMAQVTTKLKGCFSIRSNTISGALCITAFVSHKSWNYLSCNECKKASFVLEGIHICEDHGHQEPPPYKYNFKATVGDGTGVAEFTFFNEVGYKITGSKGPDVLSKFRPTPPNQLPVELTNIVGQTHIFQICFPANAQNGAGKFTVQDKLDIPNPVASQSTATSGVATHTITNDNVMPPQKDMVSPIAVTNLQNPKMDVPGTPIFTKEVDKDKDVATQSFITTVPRTTKEHSQVTTTPGTPAEDIIEQVAKTIVETIPQGPSKENNDVADIQTSSEQKSHGAKRSLTKDFLTESKKNKKVDNLLLASVTMLS